MIFVCQAVNHLIILFSRMSMNLLCMFHMYRDSANVWFLCTHSKKKKKILRKNKAKDKNNTMILYCQGKYKWRITLIIIHNSIIIAVNLHYFFYRYIENPGKARAACFLRNTDTQIANFGYETSVMLSIIPLLCCCITNKWSKGENCLHTGSLRLNCNFEQCLKSTSLSSVDKNPTSI